MIRRHYAGVGSRQTPPAMLAYFTSLATLLFDLGYTLRSGGADGADTAFEKGAPEKQIFLPWRRFNGNRSSFHRPPEPAFEIAAAHHPSWSKLKPGVRSLMARNVQQVLGAQCDDPSDFVLCWTENASGKGGTGQAIRVARTYGIPVFDFGGPTSAYADFSAYLNKRTAL